MRLRAPLAMSLCLCLSFCTKNKSNTEPSASEKSSSEKSAPSASKESPASPLPDNPVVELSTTMGKIKLQLDSKKAPKTVANFLGYVRKGHYNGTIFHRVIEGFMIQGGGFDTSMSEKPTDPPIQNEADNGLSNRRGTVAMARTPDPNSASAQFFINVADNTNLDHREKSQMGWGYCVFGEVIEGMDVVEKIKAVPTTNKGPMQNVPVTDVVINEAKITN
jgi:peptidyl-prolyl cis-trans isomerase B (cyclophilin B)